MNYYNFSMRFSLSIVQVMKDTILSVKSSSYFFQSDGKSTASFNHSGAPNTNTFNIDNSTEKSYLIC